MFNKRHYEAIAIEMQRLCPELPVDDHGMYDDEGYEHDALGRQLMWDDMIDRLVVMFHQDNLRFDSNRFRHACKPGRNVKARTAHLKSKDGWTIIPISNAKVRELTETEKAEMDNRRKPQPGKWSPCA